MEENEQVRAYMRHKILIPIAENDVAPRFDLAAEILIAEVEDDCIVSKRTIVMQHPSAEDLCAMILRENVRVLICNGIEEEYFQYLHWKNVRVVDSVMDTYAQALDFYLQGKI